MAIRTRLLVLLLITALVPLALTSLAYQISLRFAQRRLTENTRQVLDTNAKQALLELLQGHVEVLLRDRKLVQSLLKRQAKEVELALSAPHTGEDLQHTRSTFGFDPNLTISSAQTHPLFQDANDPNVAALNIDYRRQGYRTMPWADANEVPRMLDVLSPLTGLYHEIYAEAPEGTLWLTTNLRQSLETHYPAGGRSPEFRPAGPWFPANFRRQRERGPGTQQPRRPDSLQRGQSGSDSPLRGQREPDSLISRRIGPDSTSQRQREPGGLPQRPRGPGGPPQGQFVPGDRQQVRIEPLIVDESTGQD